MKFRKFWAGLLAAVMLLSMVPAAHAASSSEIRQEIDKLEKIQEENQEKMDEIQAEMDANWESIEEMVAYKSAVDEQIFLLYSQLDNLNQQITSYTALIAQTQTELDASLAELEELNIRYRARVRAMEEEGELTYWEVLFKAKSFTDLIDRLNMVREIAEADQRLMDQMRLATEEVAQTKATLESEKESLELSRQAQEDAMSALEEKRNESDSILRQLNADHAAMEELHAQYDEEKRQLAAEIAQAEKEYNEARAREEEERRRKEEEERKKREEEERKKQEEANKQNQNQNSGSNDSGGKEESKPPANTDKGWLQPCSYVYISSAYGKRSSGWHNGVDFAAPRGTPIYATRSGTVTKAKSMTTSYGNHVVINHGDGYSSLYAHMDYFVVSAGQYVSQGQLIGYVGSTGNSTGNHLHFTVFYNGSDVNPMQFL